MPAATPPRVVSEIAQAQRLVLQSEDLLLQAGPLGVVHAPLGVGLLDAVVGADEIEFGLGQPIGELVDRQLQLVLGGGRDLDLGGGFLQGQELRQHQLDLAQQAGRDVLVVGRHVEIPGDSARGLLGHHPLAHGRGGGVGRDRVVSAASNSSKACSWSAASKSRNR